MLKGEGASAQRRRVRRNLMRMKAQMWWENFSPFVQGVRWHISLVHATCSLPCVCCTKDYDSTSKSKWWWVEHQNLWVNGGCSTNSGRWSETKLWQSPRPYIQIQGTARYSETALCSMTAHPRWLIVRLITATITTTVEAKFIIWQYML